MKETLYWAGILGELCIKKILVAFRTSLFSFSDAVIF